MPQVRTTSLDCPDDPAAEPAQARGAHPLTQQAHEEAVRRVLDLMREDYGEDLTLGDMASAALLSPYYANRVFRALTGLQPRRFLAALRFEGAKRMLLDTGTTVTDICLQVGYSSLGSFTSRFHHWVGLSPRQFGRYREVVDRRAVPYDAVGASTTTHRGGVIRGHARTKDGFSGIAFVGLFPTPLPESTPLSCTLAEVPGPFSLEYGRTGPAYLLAAALPSDASTRECLLPGDGDLRVASLPITLRRANGRLVHEADLALRAIRPTDPPVVTALPHLLDRALAYGVSEEAGHVVQLPA